MCTHNGVVYWRDFPRDLPELYYATSPREGQKREGHGKLAATPSHLLLTRPVARAPDVLARPVLLVGPRSASGKRGGGGLFVPQHHLLAQQTPQAASTARNVKT